MNALNHNVNLPLAPEPTKTPIGSKERIEVMSWRAANGYAVIHPDDVNEISGGGLIENDRSSRCKDHRPLSILDIREMNRCKYCQNPTCRASYAMKCRVDAKVKYLCGYCLKDHGVQVAWSERGAT